ncbi:hypothetical protein CLOM_g685 [Closterium sp. NIES-68]|nr:hypothetical protein CLOM_g685 [Closterium sp. NIES-68]GJP75315.1 hypothetical protein CLOP_g5768 [Closterium sp. NIES-67]
MTLRSVQRSQRRSSTGGQPVQRTPSHGEKRGGTLDARAQGRYKRRKPASASRSARGQSADEPDDSERPARRASLRAAAGGKEGARKGKRKESEEKPVSMILPPIPSSAGALFQVRTNLTDFRARQLAMAVEAGVSSEVVWALNALQLLSFSHKDTWQHGVGPLSKAPQLLSALTSVVASWRVCSLETTDAATWRAMRGGPEGGDTAAAGQSAFESTARSGRPGRPSRLLHDPLGERICTYFPEAARPLMPAPPPTALQPSPADHPLAAAAAAAAAGGMSAYGRGHRGGGVEARGGEGGGEAGGGRGEDVGGAVAGGAGGKAEGEEGGEEAGWESELSAEERELWWAERRVFNSGDGGRGEKVQCATAASSVLRNFSFFPECAQAMGGHAACVAMLVAAMEDHEREDEEIVTNAVETLGNIAPAVDLASYPNHPLPDPSSTAPLSSALPDSAAAAPPVSLTRSAAAHAAAPADGLTMAAPAAAAAAGGAGGGGARGVMSVPRILAVLAALLRSPVAPWQVAAAEAWGRLLLCGDNDLLLLPAATHLKVYPQLSLLLASRDPDFQARALSSIALFADASPGAKYSLAHTPHLLARLLSLVTAPHPLPRVVRRAAAMLLALAREPRTRAAFTPLEPQIARAAFHCSPPAAATAGAGAGGGVGGGGGVEVQVSEALAEVLWRVSCALGAEQWRTGEGGAGENLWGARGCDT